MRWAALSLFALLLGCNVQATAPTAHTVLSLSRAPDGYFELLLTGAPVPARAVQAEIVADSPAALLLQDPSPPVGLPIDTVKVEMRGTNRAILFAGDKRGVRLSESGVVARFHLRPSGGGPLPVGATISLRSAVVVANDASRISTTLGGPIPAE
jgi:hypothetical protein